MKDLSDHVCVVTGGSRGLGYAIAQALAEQGGRLVLVSRSQGDCTAAAARLSGTADVEAVGIGADVSDDAQVERMVRSSPTHPVIDGQQLMSQMSMT